MEVLGKIRRLYYRDGLSFSEIARKTGHTRNTVKRWLKTAEGVKPAYRRQGRDTKIAPYAAQLVKALEIDAHRPKRDRRTALKLFGEIQAAGFRPWSIFNAHGWSLLNARRHITTVSEDGCDTTHRFFLTGGVDYLMDVRTGTKVFYMRI